MSDCYQKYVNIPLRISEKQFDQLIEITEMYNEFYYDYLHLISLRMVGHKPMITPTEYYNDKVKNYVKKATNKQPIRYLSRWQFEKILTSATQVLYSNSSRIWKLYKEKCLTVDKLSTEVPKWIKSAKFYNPGNPYLTLRVTSTERIRNQNAIRIPHMGEISVCSEKLSMLPKSASIVRIYIRPWIKGQYKGALATMYCNIPQPRDDDGFIQLLHKE